MSETLRRIATNRYDWTAIIGVLVAVVPDIAQELTRSDLGLSNDVLNIVRLIGLALAAYGRSVKVRP